MAINSTHPLYDAHVEDWVLMRDAHAGERQVKSKRTVYLPATPAQEVDGMDAGKPGERAYSAYLQRAKFPDYVSEAVSRYVGLMHAKEAEIELPAVLEPMRERATPNGESLLALLRRINEQQLMTGRLGMLLDLPLAGNGEVPYIALYYGETIRNWDESSDGEGLNNLQLVVLDESGPVREQDFTWTTKERYRVCLLATEAPPAPGEAEDEADEQGAEPGKADVTERAVPLVYRQAVVDFHAGNTDVDLTNLMTPMYRGRPLEVVPFVFVNACDLLPSPDKPPLIGLGRDCMTIYRAEADYRHTLFMQGQDTFVTIGTVTQNGEHVGPAADSPVRVGAGAHVALDLHGDAKYVGIGAQGLAEQRESLENDRKSAESRSAMLVSPSAGKQESGDALSTRMAAQTANLTQVARTGAAALQSILRIAAQWVGADPESVRVTPNMEFAPLLVTAQEVTQLMAGRALGLPLSRQSVHGVLRDRGLTQFDYETELRLIEEEDSADALRKAALNESLGLDPAGNPLDPPEGGPANGPANGPGGPQAQRNAAG